MRRGVPLKFDDIKQFSLRAVEQSKQLRRVLGDVVEEEEPERGWNQYDWDHVVSDAWNNHNRMTGNFNSGWNDIGEGDFIASMGNFTVMGIDPVKNDEYSTTGHTCNPSNGRFYTFVGRKGEMRQCPYCKTKITI